MGIYIIILVSLVFLGFFTLAKGKTARAFGKFGFIVPILILFVFAALRSESVGADTGWYCQAYMDVNNVKFIHLLSWAHDTDQEIGYVLWNKLLVTILPFRQNITIVTSAILCFLIYSIVKKDSRYPWLSVLIYLTFACYQSALNMMPSAIAGLLMVWGIRYVKERRFWKYLVLAILVSFFMHLSAIAFLPIYFLYGMNVYRPKHIVFGMATLLVVFFFKEDISKIVHLFIPNKYTGYILTTTYLGVLITYCVDVLIFLFCIFIIIFTKVPPTSKNTWFSFLLLAGIICVDIVALAFPAFSRVRLLLVPYFILIIPQIINSIKLKKTRQLIMVCFIIICCVMYIGRLSINNIGGTMPYSFFWQ